MGVNVKLYLPKECLIRQVADVAGVLLGNNKVEEKIEGIDGNFKRICVEGIGTAPGDLYNVASAYITINLNKENEVAAEIAIAEGECYKLSYSFEGFGGKRFLNPVCTPSKQALCLGLARFFGGVVDLNDCDDVKVDYYIPTRKDIIDINLDEHFINFYKRLSELQPLSQKDMDEITNRKKRKKSVPKE